MLANFVSSTNMDNSNNSSGPIGTDPSQLRGNMIVTNSGGNELRDNEVLFQNYKNYTTIYILKGKKSASNSLFDAWCSSLYPK